MILFVVLNVIRVFPYKEDTSMHFIKYHVALSTPRPYSSFSSFFSELYFFCINVKVNAIPRRNGNFQRCALWRKRLWRKQEILAHQTQWKTRQFNLLVCLLKLKSKYTGAESVPFLSACRSNGYVTSGLLVQ